MARVAGPRMRAVLFVLVLLPLWSSYLVRVYAWRLMLAQDGALNWSLGKLGLPDPASRTRTSAMWIVFSYIWLPFMILPIYAALERIPHSYLEASRDLGARGWRTFRSVVLPLALPGMVAGSIFTFSLTLGDYITPVLVGGARGSSSATSSTNRSASRTTCRSRRRSPPCRSIVMGVYLAGRAPARRVRGA